MPAYEEKRYVFRRHADRVFRRFFPASSCCEGGSSAILRVLVRILEATFSGNLLSYAAVSPRRQYVSFYSLCYSARAGYRRGKREAQKSTRVVVGGRAANHLAIYAQR